MYRHYNVRVNGELVGVCQDPRAEICSEDGNYCMMEFGPDGKFYADSCAYIQDGNTIERAFIYEGLFAEPCVCIWTKEA